jgi:hypothetical protein
MVIDLATFQVIKEIEVDDNLHRLLADSHGQLWVSTRGNYFDVSPALYCLKDDKVVARLEIPISSMTIVGDSLYYIGTTFSYVDGGYKKDFGIVDVALQRCSVAVTFEAPEIKNITLPYGIIVNPHDRDFYILDAKNYVSSGELLHFDADGNFLWRVSTGDIPSRGVFLESK